MPQATAAAQTTSVFRQTPNGSLDLEYLRICAVHRLLARKRIGFARAVELLAERKVEKPKRLVELWRGNHLTDMGA